MERNEEEGKGEEWKMRERRGRKDRRERSGRRGEKRMGVGKEGNGGPCSLMLVSM